MEENQENNFYELEKIMIDDDKKLTETGVKIVALMSVAIAFGILKKLFTKKKY